MKRPNLVNCIQHLITFYLITDVLGWGGDDDYDDTKFGMSSVRDEWMYGSSSIGIRVEGCVWGYVDDRENMGCMEDESEDGTTLWYFMANCRRAQVAYSVFASSSGSTSCNSGDYKETFVTKNGLAEFVSTLGSYGYYSPFSDDDVAELPICEQDGDGYYLSVGCSSSGTFTIDRFTDQYCLQHYDTYEYLDDINSAVKNDLSSCFNCYDANIDQDPYYSLCAYLIPYSGSCSELDSDICQTNSFVKSSGSGRASSSTSNSLKNRMNLSLPNKLKYGLGGIMLAASGVMFLGILVTNRRKRRALMHRKFRQSSEKKHRSKSRSKSKSRSSRGSSRNRQSESGGIYA